MNRLRAVLFQSVKSKLGRTGESELAERETSAFASFARFPRSRFPSPGLSLASLDFLARVTILRDCSQSKI